MSVVGETGSFGTLTLDRGLELSLTRGLASVARSTLTWVITGGCDGGVMRWAGEATSGNLGKGACIGIAPWQKIKQVEVVQANGQDRYTAQGIGDATESTNAALEKHHTFCWWMTTRIHSGAASLIWQDGCANTCASRSRCLW